MQVINLFKISAVAAALALTGCGGDIKVSEGDVNNVTQQGDTINQGPVCEEGSTCNIGGSNPDEQNTRDDSENATTGFPTDIQNALDKGLATDVSADSAYASIATSTGKKVYKLDPDATFVEDVTLTNDATWIITGRTAVGEDKGGSDSTQTATLYIQQGTSVVGETGNDFIVVRRSSQIKAVGTATSPINFTSIQDVSGQETAIGQWGGMVLLGNAPANSCGDQIGEATADELANCGVSAEGAAGNFGGNMPEDSSGELKYIVVKHAGKALGNGDELNGISFAGVGSGTKVSHIQIHENLDDGIEFFGGTVNVDHVVLTSIGDDSLDWSFGWTGTASHVYIQQSAADGDNAIEADNSEFDATASPQTNPNIDHVTIVGANGTNGVRLRAGTQGALSNILITGPATYEKCLRVNGNEAVAHANNGDLTISNSVMACDTPANQFASSDLADTQAWFEGQAGNMTETAGNLMLDDNGYMPLQGSPLLLPDNDYIGAFDGQTNWMEGWTVAINGGFPTDINNALAQGYATDISGQFPEITDKPVYKLGADTTFTTNVTLTNDAHWVLQGRTAVGGDNTDNAVLYIQNGTTLIGETGDDFLVVRRGSKVEALGNSASPITMTSIQDVLGNETGIGQWGGVVLLGNAPANSCGDQTGEATADELANCGVSAEGAAGNFGGNMPEDNSGTLRYVIVKHAGKALGNGDELNGISFAGVGSKTKVEYIQVHENLDDGIEFFGGTVNVRNVVLSSIGDDSLDWSFGWTGKAQNVYIQQSAVNGDNAIEADNSEFDASASPQTMPTISNVTIVGASGRNGIRLRAGTQGILKNVVVTGPDDYAKCLRVNGDESVAHAENGDLTMTHSFVACSTENNFASSDLAAPAAWFNDQDGNMVTTNDALLLSTDGFSPKSSSPLLGAGYDMSDDDAFFTPTDYVGAFDGQNNWMEDWTVAINSNIPDDVTNALTQALATDVSGQYPAITDKPVYKLAADTEFTADVVLSNDAHWILQGRTAVGGDKINNTTLYIEKGTTLIGETGDDFLVVRRGSKIEAVGTATQPITMTSIQNVTGQETAIGQWGGLVVLGNAPANSCGDQTGEATADELANCGVSAEGAAGNFGGNMPEDNSGTLKYVVIKHAGKALGNGDELNGISFAGVGSGTDVSYIHIHQNLDDGIEFFGGTMNISHVVLTEIGDDSLDWSFGWTGNAQFVLIKQGTANGDNAIEADNSEFDASATPQTNPTVANVTVLGASGRNGVRLRAGTQAVLKNFVITGPDDYAKCLRVNGDESVAHAADGSLSITHSVVACAASNNFASTNLANNTWFTGKASNEVTTADLLGLSGYMPASDSMLIGSGFDASTLDTFFEATNFIGAMDVSNDWTAGWVTVGLED